MQITINVSPELLAKIEEVKGLQSRSGFIVACVKEHLAGGETDKVQLNRDLKTLRETQGRLENEVAYLRDQNSRMLDAVSQRLLTDGKPSFWSRFRRKQT
jgi:hypothetical protein